MSEHFIKFYFLEMLCWYPYTLKGYAVTGKSRLWPSRLNLKRALSYLYRSFPDIKFIKQPIFAFILIQY